MKTFRDIQPFNLDISLQNFLSQLISGQIDFKQVKFTVISFFKACHILSPYTRMEIQIKLVWDHLILFGIHNYKLQHVKVLKY